MDDEQKQAILQKIVELRDLLIFKEMSDRDIFEIMKRSEIQSFAQGDHVFREGDTERGLYVIIRGEFEVTTRTVQQDQLIRYSCAGAGLVFGEMSFLDHQSRSATVTATETSEVFCMTRERFEELLLASPISAARFMLGIAEILSRRLRGSDQRLKHST